MTDALDTTPAVETLELRSADLQYRESEETGYLEGFGVPWGQTVTIHNRDGSSFLERFERGSVEMDGTVWLYDSHKTPIGVVEVAETRDEGLWVRAKLALSDLAKTVHQQLLNGAVNKLSVGFTALEHRDDNGVVVRTRTRLREVSVVARPAYSLASVLAVREETTDRTSVTNHKETTVENTDATVGLTEVRGEIEELSRRFDAFGQPTAPAEKVDFRSAAQVLKDLVKGDADTVERYNDIQTRAYTGGTTADAPIKDAWIADLTDIFDASSGVLSNIFNTAALPSTGLNLEYAELASNTVKFEEVAEGEDLPVGKVTLTNRTVPVKLYGGAVQLTRMQIERSTLPVLQHTLEALVVAAAARKKAELRAYFNTVVTAREAIASNAGVQVLGATLAAATAGHWEDALIDASVRYDAQNSAPEALIVSVSVFKKLRSLTVSGERVFIVGERNSSGTLNLPGLTGNLAGLQVVADPGLTGDKAVFVNGSAIRQFDSGLVSLQDENIINLSKDFSAYRYGAIAAERPHLIVPVKLSA